MKKKVKETQKELKFNQRNVFKQNHKYLTSGNSENMTHARHFVNILRLKCKSIIKNLMSSSKFNLKIFFFTFY